MDRDASRPDDAAPARWLLTVETGGNQAYVFASNRLRESVGASHLVMESTTKWLRTALKDAEAPPHRVLQEASGKAFVLFEPTPRSAVEAVVRQLTLKALRHAPGLDLFGAIVPAPAPEEPAAKMVDAVLAANRRVEKNRSGLPGAIVRHPRLPLTADCASTSAGAAELMPRPGEGRSGREQMAVSAAVAAKRRAASKGLEALRKQVGELEERTLPRDLRQVERLFEGEDTLSWLAVVHADVNGLGQALMNLTANNQVEYLKRMQEFSVGVEEAALAALRAGLRSVQPVAGGTIIPALPLIAAGDDLTVVLPGSQALPFVVAYLRAFEEATATGILGELAPGGRLGACAGIAVVKPHHPFSDAYALAEKLADSAKRVKRLVVDSEGRSVPCSAFDFHLLYDSASSDLKDIRDERTVDEEATVLHDRPYVVSLPERLKTASASAREWAAFHAVERLDELRAILVARRGDDPTQRDLPRGQVLALREVLPQGAEPADRRAKIVAARTPSIARLLSDGSLFRKLPPEDDGQQSTALLDALDVVELNEDPIVPAVEIAPAVEAVA